jgi:hypothetical protein
MVVAYVADTYTVQNNLITDTTSAEVAVPTSSHDSGTKKELNAPILQKLLTSGCNP